MAIQQPALPSVPPGLENGLWSLLSRIKESIEMLLGRRGTYLNKAVTYQNLTDLGIVEDVAGAPGTSGASGWFDDGTFFRVTVVNGIITDISDSTAGGTG